MPTRGTEDERLTEPCKHTIQQLGPEDLHLMRGLLHLFGEVFEEAPTYTGRPPSDAYLQHLLGGETFLAIAASVGQEIVGGLAAYELRKFEQERSEIYVYDLAVAAGHRRRGIATALIRRLQEIATQRGAWVIFVQADKGDAEAVALYSKLGIREDVLHFDIPPVPEGGQP